MVALKVEPSMVLCKRSPPPRVISSSGLCSELCEECQRGNEGREGDFFLCLLIKSLMTNQLSVEFFLRSNKPFFYSGRFFNTEKTNKKNLVYWTF